MSDAGCPARLPDLHKGADEPPLPGRWVILMAVAWTAGSVAFPLLAAPFATDEQSSLSALASVRTQPVRLLAPWRADDGFVVAQPLYLACAGVARVLVPGERISLRLVSAGAMLGAALGLWLLVRRREGPWVAFAALVSFISLPGYGQLAALATPGAFLVALVVALVLCTEWSRDGTDFRALLAGGIAGCVSLICTPLGVLLLVPWLVREPGWKGVRRSAVALIPCAAVALPKILLDWHLMEEGVFFSQFPYLVQEERGRLLGLVGKVGHWHGLLLAGPFVAAHLMAQAARVADRDTRTWATWLALLGVAWVGPWAGDRSLVLVGVVPVCVWLARLLCGRPPFWLGAALAVMAGWPLGAMGAAAVYGNPGTWVLAAAWSVATGVLLALASWLNGRIRWKRATGLGLLLLATVPTHIPPWNALSPIEIAAVAYRLRHVPTLFWAAVVNHPVGALTDIHGENAHVVRVNASHQLARLLDGPQPNRLDVLVLCTERDRTLVEQWIGNALRWKPVGIRWSVTELEWDRPRAWAGLFTAVQADDGVTLYRHGRVARQRSARGTVMDEPALWYAPEEGPYTDIERLGEAWYVLHERGTIVRHGAGPDLAPVGAQSPCVDLEIVRDGQGYYVLEQSGRIHAMGTAQAFGVTGRRNRKPWRIKAMSDGSGYVVFHRTQGLSVAGSITMDTPWLDFGWNEDTGRDLEFCPVTGVPIVLDAAGGLHRLGSGPGYVSPYWNPEGRDCVDLEIEADGTIRVLTVDGKVYVRPKTTR